MAGIQSKLTKAQFDKKVKLIKDIFEKWLKVLKMSPVYVEYIFVEQDSAGQDDAQTNVFDIRMNSPYRDCQLKIYPEALRLTPERLSHTLLHEVLHLVLDPIMVSRLSPDEYFEFSVEQVTELLALIIYELKEKP